jgi:pyridoxal phosphate enzyme (YggS family)
VIKLLLPALLLPSAIGAGSADMDIAQNVKEVRERIAHSAARAGRSPDEITIIAVTKNVEESAIQRAVEAGIEHFGENRVQEAQRKIIRLPGSGSCPTWHMIGHLQRNKVQTALKIFDIIHSIDSIRLAQSISAQAERAVPILLQINVAREKTKGGLQTDELNEAVTKISRLPNLSIKGLMTVAPMVDDPEEVRPVFKKLRELRDSFGMEHLSMGMSNDFEIAVEEGATMVRLGRIIFGERL